MGMTFKLEEWPAGRLRRLAELWPDPTWTIHAMAQELGVSEHAVLRRAKELGLQGRPNTVGDPWPNEWSTDRMTVRPPPARHWRSYGDDKLPTGAEALAEPFAAFPSWFMRIECDRCGKVRMVNEAYTRQRDMPIRDILARMRHEDCGGRAGKVELITGIEGASTRRVRKIVLRG
jgi:hypothetical protein